MIDKDLIKRVAANHLRKALGEEDPQLPYMGGGEDALSDGLQSIAQRLKITANKQGVMQMRDAFVLANELIVLLNLASQRDGQPAVQNIAKRMMREHKALAMTLV